MTNIEKPQISQSSHSKTFLTFSFAGTINKNTSYFLPPPLEMFHQPSDMNNTVTIFASDYFMNNYLTKSQLEAIDNKIKRSFGIHFTTNFFNATNLFRKEKPVKMTVQLDENKNHPPFVKTEADLSTITINFLMDFCVYNTMIKACDEDFLSLNVSVSFNFEVLIDKKIKIKKENFDIVSWNVLKNTFNLASHILNNFVFTYTTKIVEEYIIQENTQKLEILLNKHKETILGQIGKTRVYRGLGYHKILFDLNNL